MPRKTGAQKRKPKQTSGQEGQDLMEECLGKLRRPEDVESIREVDSIKEKLNTIRILLQTMVNVMKTKSDEALGFLFDDIVNYSEVAISLGRLAPDGVSHKDAERVAELEGMVEEKEEEIKRLGDGCLDSEEKLTGLRERMVGKVKEIKELKERAQKIERDFEDFRAFVKAEAEEKDRLGIIERSRQSDEKREEKEKIRELQGEKERIDRKSVV